MNNPGPTVSTSARISRYWFPVLVWLIIEFKFSTNSFSSDETSQYIVPLLQVLFRNLTPDRLDFWHHVVRKGAHITEYSVLGILVYRAFQIDVANRTVLRLLTVAFVGAAAIMDEFHQSFVSSRTSSIYDVGFDCIGGMVALALMWIWRSSRVAEE